MWFTLSGETGFIHTPSPKFEAWEVLTCPIAKFGIKLARERCHGKSNNQEQLTGCHWTMYNYKWQRKSNCMID